MIIALLILIFICVFSFKMFIVTSKIHKQGKEARVEAMQKLGVVDNRDYFPFIEHINGLNVPEGALCEVGITPDKLVIKNANNQYSINLDKIRYVDFKMDIDKTVFNKNGSLIKGIAGGAVFGVAGAIVGSQGKQVVQREVKGYAIVGYKSSDDEIKYIVLGDRLINSQTCSRIVNRLKPFIVEDNIKQIEL